MKSMRHQQHRSLQRQAYIHFFFKANGGQVVYNGLQILQVRGQQGRCQRVQETVPRLVDQRKLLPPTHRHHRGEGGRRVQPRYGALACSASPLEARRWPAPT